MNKRYIVYAVAVIVVSTVAERTIVGLSGGGTMTAPAILALVFVIGLLALPILLWNRKKS